MKRNEIKAKIPGITDEQLNWLMSVNGADINREKTKREEAPRLEEIRRLKGSCAALLDLLNEPDDLRDVLLHVNRLYRNQCRTKREWGKRK